MKDKSFLYEPKAYLEYDVVSIHITIYLDYSNNNFFSIRLNGGKNLSQWDVSIRYSVWIGATPLDCFTTFKSKRLL